MVGDKPREVGRGHPMQVLSLRMMAQHQRALCRRHSTCRLLRHKNKALGTLRAVRGSGTAVVPECDRLCLHMGLDQVPWNYKIFPNGPNLVVIKEHPNRRAMKCQLALFLPASHPNQTSASSPEQGLGNSSLPGSGCPRSLVLDSVRSQSSSPGAPSQSGKCGLFMCMCTRTCICIHTHTHTYYVTACKIVLRFSNISSCLSLPAI